MSRVMALAGLAILLSSSIFPGCGEESDRILWNDRATGVSGGKDQNAESAGMTTSAVGTGKVRGGIKPLPNCEREDCAGETEEKMPPLKDLCAAPFVLCKGEKPPL